MPIVQNWAQPLTDAVEEKLSRLNSFSAEDLKQAEQTLALLSGVPLPDTLLKRLENAKVKLEESYQFALELTHKRGRADIQYGVEKLKALGAYKDAAQEIQIAEERIRQLKKRKVIVWLSVAAAVALLIAGLVIRNVIHSGQVTEKIVQAQQLADAGAYAEALDAAQTLAQTERLNEPQTEQLQQVTETALERMAAKEGFEAAVARHQLLKEQTPGMLGDGFFWYYTATQLKNGEKSAIDRWDLLTLMKRWEEKPNIPVFGAEEEKVLLDQCLLELAEEMNAGSQRDMAAWAAGSLPVMDSLQANPNAALQFLYALNGAGYDLAELFPEGILLSLPLGAQVQALSQWISSDDTAELPRPDMTALLPVSILERKVNAAGKNIYQLSSSSESSLEKQIEEAQKENSHYEVRLLAEYLFSIPESLRPAAFEDCTALLCRQNSYVYCGPIYSTSTTKNSRTGFIVSSSTTYYPAYSGLDLVAVYDLKTKGACVTLYGEPHLPLVQNDLWFKANKSKSISFLTTEENMLGSFDPDTLRQEYEEAVDLINFYRMLYDGSLDWLLETEEDATDDAA